MRKIPTLFKRDPEDMRKVLPEINEGCELVLAGEGIPTRKYDGTCCMLDAEGRWWARREVKPGKQVPAHFAPVEHDPTTGKTVGWEPMEQSAFAKWHAEAINIRDHGDRPLYYGSTCELCGPKVNGNPEGFEYHELIRHEDAQRLDIRMAHDIKPSTAFIGLKDFLHEWNYEGIVWHHPDGRMAKIKKRDFP